MKNLMISAAIFAGLALASCGEDTESINPPEPEKPEVPTPPKEEKLHKYKAPLYWSVYEYCYELEKKGIPQSSMDISPSEWDKIIDWIATDLKPYGYDMICTDGFIPMLSNDGSGYMSHYGSMPLKTLVKKCKEKGLKVGVYDNPLWIHGPNETPVKGTNYTFGSLDYNGKGKVVNPDANDLWFHWAVAENPGTREYIDGFFRHFAELGIDFIRMDFLSWYEDGKDRNMGIVGRGYGRDSYALALKYICESAQKYGIFTSLVMPHLYKDAELEAKYGNMFRIVSDTADGGWWHCSSRDQGKAYTTWPNCMNMFDGFTYWSHVSGREKAILDGDFIRLNKFASDTERETVISLQLMAGGPIAVADQYNTIGDNTKFYTNEELLELNTDRFVGKPLSDKLGDRNNEIWYGQMTNGDYVVGLFNRSDSQRSYSLKLEELGIDGELNQRDLWKHADEGASAVIEAKIPPHGCKIVRLSK